MFPGSIQGGGNDLSRPTLHEAGLTNGLSLPNYIHHPIGTSRRGILWVLSTKECHHPGPRKKAFSAMEPTLWNIVPLELKIGPNCLAFRKALKSIAVLGCLATGEGFYNGLLSLCKDGSATDHNLFLFWNYY